MAEKILIVHDDHATRVRLASALVEAGYDTSAVGSFGTALHALSADEPDLLVAALRLSDSNGLQLLASCPRAMPAILLSDFPDHALEAEARHLGADYLVSPVAPGDLVALVRQKLAGADAAHTPARRWTRRPLDGEWHVRVADSYARVIDVSYGGACIEVQRVPGAWLPMSFQLLLPYSRFGVDVNVIWKRRHSDETWVCGTAVADADRPAWSRFVDSLS